LDKQVWTIEKLADEYGVSIEEIQRWMLDPTWVEAFKKKEYQTILETRFSQLTVIANAKMVALANMASLISTASQELKDKVNNGEINALEALSNSKNLCMAQESGDKSLTAILALENMTLGISEILNHIEPNADETEYY